MSTKFKNLRNDLEDLEQEGQFDIDESRYNTGRPSGSKLANYILLFAFITTLTFYAGSKINFSGLQLNPIEDFVEQLNQPNEDLLNRMGAWMEEMGYGALTHEELIELRNEGVTATFTSQVRAAGFEDVTLEQMVDLGNAGVSASYITEIQDAGFSDITLDQLIELDNAGVSATFTRMMGELGYDLTVQDLLDLERGDVTAHFTSNMLDMGYTMEELTKENLIRMRNIGVTHQQAARLIEQRDSRPTVDELIRDRISNQ